MDIVCMLPPTETLPTILSKLMSFWNVLESYAEMIVFLFLTFQTSTSGRNWQITWTRDSALNSAGRLSLSVIGKNETKVKHLQGWSWISDTE